MSQIPIKFKDKNTENNSLPPNDFMFTLVFKTTRQQNNKNLIKNNKRNLKNRENFPYSVN